MKRAVISPLILFAGIISTCFCADDLRIGKFEMTSSPSDPAYDEYMKEMGFSAEIRGFFVKVSQQFDISKDGSKWTLKLTAGPNSKTFVFQSGEEFEEVLVDGRKCKTLYKIGEKVVARLLTCPDVSSNDLIEFTKEGMTLKRMAKNKILTQVFKRL